MVEAVRIDGMVGLWFRVRAFARETTDYTDYTVCTAKGARGWESKTVPAVTRDARDPLREGQVCESRVIRVICVPSPRATDRNHKCPSAS